MGDGARRVSVVTASVVALVVLVGCGSGPNDSDAVTGGPAESVVSTTAPGVTSSSVVSSRAPESTAPTRERPIAAWVEASDDATDAEVPAAAVPAGELALDGCRWHGRARFSFDLTWTPVDLPAGPIVLPLQMGFVVGDQGVGVGGVATVDRPGPFTVEVTIRVGEDGTWSVGRDLGLPAVSCGAGLIGRDESGGSATLAPDPRPASGDAGATDTIEARAAAIDLVDTGASLLPLAWLYADAEPPGLDRLYVHPTASLLGIEVRYDDPCWTVRSRYGPEAFDDDVVEVSQEVGCPPPPVPRSGGSLAVADDVWDVTVTGPAGVIDGFAQELELLWSERIAPFDATARFDADRYFDQHVAEFGTTELARLDWAAGRVLVTMSAGDLQTMEVLTAVPGGFNGGGSGQPCRDFATFETVDESGRGFVVVAVAGDRTASIDDDGDGPGAPVLIPLAPSAVAGFAVGLHDLRSSITSFDPSRIAVLDADGSASTCVQGQPGAVSTTVP